MSPTMTLTRAETEVKQTVDAELGLPTSIGLKELFEMVAKKRQADILRFRTCCVDPRASK